ncbi:ATP-binding cassette, subfamily B (MDR/TAP), member 7 [Pancytospora philotis]|nr:ATP-binding cassette, subfamily B (MDR/TAP), member 7 [Pancytospora philotis]
MLKPSNRAVLGEVWREYVVGVPATRKMLFPTMLVMVLAKYLEVSVAGLYKRISSAIKTGVGIREALLMYALVYVLSVVIGELQSYFICRAGQVGYRLASKHAYGHFVSLQPAEFKRHGKGSIQNAIAKRAQAAQDIIDVFTLNFFPTLITVVFVSASVILHIGLIPMLLINAAIVAYAVATVRITSRRNVMRAEINAAQNRVSCVQLDGLLNHDTVHAYNNAAFEEERYDAALAKLEAHSTELERSKYVLNLAQRSIWCGLSIVIIAIAVLGIFIPRIGTEDLALFIGIIEVLVRSLNNFGFMYGKYQSALVNMRLVELSKRARGGAVTTAPRFESSIAVSGMEVRARDRILLSGVTFAIAKGDKVAIVGRNGVGKSSLLQTLLRVRPGAVGSVRIDGQSTDDMPDGHLRELIAYVPQDAHLFNDTVMYNIKYGAPKASDEEVLRLSEELGLHASMGRLDEGYMTHVGEQGFRLSGGEKQKIVFLRALMRRTPILVMDEPTANLDKRAEEQIFEQIRKYSGLTVVAIVHNLELLRYFDRILLVEPGRVEEVSDRAKLCETLQNAASS